MKACACSGTERVIDCRRGVTGFTCTRFFAFEEERLVFGSRTPPPMQLDWPRPDAGRSISKFTWSTGFSAGPQFRSKAYVEAFNLLCRFARAGTVTILIEGESGTGKTQH